MEHKDDKPDKGSGQSPQDTSIDRPRLTPQGRAGKPGEGENSTDPASSGPKQGQPDKPEG